MVAHVFYCEYCIAEEAVVEELSPYKELFTTVVFQQGHVAAATSCFCVYYSCQIS